MKPFETLVSEHDELVNSREGILDEISFLNGRLCHVNERIANYRYDVTEGGISFRGRTGDELAKLAELATTGLPLGATERPHYHDELARFIDAIKANVGGPAILANQEYQHVPFYRFNPFIIPTRPRLEIGAGTASRLLMPISNGFAGNVHRVSDKGEDTITEPGALRRISVSELWLDKYKVVSDPEDIEMEDFGPALWIGSKAVSAALLRPDILLDKKSTNYGSKRSQIATIGLAVSMFAESGAFKKSDRRNLERELTDKEDEAIEEVAIQQISIGKTRKIKHRLGREGASDEAKHLIKTIEDDERYLVLDALEMLSYWQTIKSNLAAS